MSVFTDDREWVDASPGDVQYRVEWWTPRTAADTQSRLGTDNFDCIEDCEEHQERRATKEEALKLARQKVADDYFGCVRVVPITLELLDVHQGHSIYTWNADYGNKSEEVTR